MNFKSTIPSGDAIIHPDSYFWIINCELIYASCYINYSQYFKLNRQLVLYEMDMP